MLLAPCVFGLLLARPNSSYLAPERKGWTPWKLHCIAPAALVTVGREEAIGAIKTWSPGRRFPWPGEDEAAAGRKSGSNQLGCARSDAGEHWTMRSGLDPRLLGSDLTAHLLELFRKNLLELVGIQATVMDGGGFLHPPGLQRAYFAAPVPDQVVVGGAQVTGWLFSLPFSLDRGRCWRARQSQSRPWRAVARPRELHWSRRCQLPRRCWCRLPAWWRPLGAFS